MIVPRGELIFVTGANESRVEFPSHVCSVCFRTILVLFLQEQIKDIIIPAGRPAKLVTVPTNCVSQGLWGIPSTESDQQAPNHF